MMDGSVRTDEQLVKEFEESMQQVLLSLYAEMSEKGLSFGVHFEKIGSIWIDSAADSDNDNDNDNGRREARDASQMECAYFVFTVDAVAQRTMMDVTLLDSVEQRLEDEYQNVLNEEGTVSYVYTRMYST